MTLAEFFKENSKVAVAFSGGVDSAYLLHCAVKSGANVKAYFVKSAFQPQFELNDAMRLSKQLQIEIQIINLDILSVDRVVENPTDRCYYCKKKIFTAIINQAKRDNINLLIDGTNASDKSEERPGMRALKELSVRSPLKECGLTKDVIRRLSKEAGLFTWDKPSYACLATRIQKGERITEEKLIITEKAEDFLFSLGFCDFRVRMNGTAAKIQLLRSQFSQFEKQKDEIFHALKKYYSSITLDTEARDE